VPAGSVLALCVPPAFCPALPCVPCAPCVPCDCPLWLPLALSRPDCGAGGSGVDDDLEVLAPDAVEGLPALLELEALDEELEEELEVDERDGIDGLGEGELEDELGLDGELELDDDEELDGIAGVELCEDCWLVDSQAAKSRDAAPIRSIFVTGDLFIWLVPIT